MSKKIATTIGITAYNEQANIKNLLRSLLEQKGNNFLLKKIIVISDGSTDKTVTEVNAIKDSRVQLVIGKTRKGQSTRQNEVLRKADTEILILLDADVLPAKTDFVSQMICAYKRKPNIGLVGASIKPTYSTKLLGKVLSWHMKWKNNLYRNIKQSNNIYLCHGRARAFSKPFYKQLKWPKMWSEDAYSYLENKRLGFNFVFAPKAAVYYQSPESVSDHLRQSKRFLSNSQVLSNFYDKETLTEAFYLPKSLFLKKVVEGIITHPFYASAYIALFIYSFLQAKIPFFRPKQDTAIWEPSISTKTVNI